MVPYICWGFCFRHFFLGHLPLFEDAISYADHIRFYTDNLSHGVYPLWDPTWCDGAPNDFFLRRIGDANPLLFLIVLLKWFGVSSSTAYLIFLGVYYFLAGWAFYLIARLLLVDRFFAFMAYVLLLFSSWGSEIFYNYIIIIFLPIIWFFYFLLSFSRKAQRAYFLGICFCAGMIVTTYIPFFFLTIMVVFSFLCALFYWHELSDFLKRSLGFFIKNKVFTILCICFLLISCIPGLLFYKESKSGDFVLPGRHSGADSSSAIAVGLDNVASGDIISHGYFDRILDNHTHLDMGDIYLPYVFFLILLTSTFARAYKLIFFLLFNILAIALITVTSAAGVHRFLYEHVIIFKFIRNIYYFFWLAILPMGILLSVAAFKSLLESIDRSSKKAYWLLYIIACHLIFIFFLRGHQEVLWGAWTAIGISLLYFLLYFFCEKKISYLIGFCMIFLAVFIQSAQVYESLSGNLFRVQKNVEIREHLNVASAPLAKMDIYYSSSLFAILVKYIDPQVLDDYRGHKLMLYDNVVPCEDNTAFLKTLQLAMANNANIAFVPRSESTPGNWVSKQSASLHADNDPITSGKVSVVSFDANTWVLRTHLADNQFLVINDNYNLGWHAFINGHPTRLFRANFSFKGVWVPAGDSKIVLRFSDPKEYIFRFFLIGLFAGTFLYLLVLLKRNRTSNV